MRQGKTFGFGRELPFDIKMAVSQFSNNQKSIDSEVQLADSGYGQGPVLVNPVHLASIYSAFVNKGRWCIHIFSIRRNRNRNTGLKTHFLKKRRRS